MQIDAQSNEKFAQKRKELALSYAKQEEYKKALNILDILMTGICTDADLYMICAKIYHKMGDTRRTIEYMELTALYDNSKYMDLSKLYLKEGRREDEIWAILNAVLYYTKKENYDLVGTMYSYIAEYFREQGRHEEAARFFTKAMNFHHKCTFNKNIREKRRYFEKAQNFLEKAESSLENVTFKSRDIQQYIEKHAKELRISQKANVHFL
jgi:tetratricopeptide (TPR) repeat protein